MEHGISFWREGSEIHRESVWEAPRAFVWEDHPAHTFRDQGFWWECSVLVFCVSPEQISSLCAEEAAAQEQTGQVEECLKVNLLKIKTEMCKKVASHHQTPYLPDSLFCLPPLFPFNAIVCTF